MLHRYRSALTAFAGLILVLQPLAIKGQQGGRHQDTYSVVGADKVLIPLPSVPGVTKSKVKALGMGGSAALVEIPGLSATVRLKSTDAQLFVVTVQHGTVPEMLRISQEGAVVKLHKLDLKKDHREWMISNRTSYGVYSRGKTDFAGVPVNVSQYELAPDSIQIEPRSRLDPGEYAFVTLDYDAYRGSSYRFHCFGIDQ